MLGKCPAAKQRSGTVSDDACFLGILHRSGPFRLTMATSSTAMTCVSDIQGFTSFSLLQRARGAAPHLLQVAGHLSCLSCSQLRQHIVGPLQLLLVAASCQAAAAVVGDGAPGVWCVALHTPGDVTQVPRQVSQQHLQQTVPQGPAVIQGHVGVATQGARAAVVYSALVAGDAWCVQRLACWQDSTHVCLFGSCC